MEIEPDAPTKAPNHLIESSFGIKEMKMVETLLDGVVLPTTAG
jgi:hypothetical protein